MEPLDIFLTSTSTFRSPKHSSDDEVICLQISHEFDNNCVWEGLWPFATRQFARCCWLPTRHGTFRNTWMLPFLSIAFINWPNTHPLLLVSLAVLKPPYFSEQFLLLTLFVCDVGSHPFLHSTHYIQLDEMEQSCACFALLGTSGHA